MPDSSVEEKKTGRPEKKVDFNIFEELCKIQCTQQEICNVLDMDHKTLTARTEDRYGEPFSQTYKRFSDSGRMSLRRAQMRSAIGGNVVMQIWLGKQYLDQSEKMQVVSQEYINQEIEIIAPTNGNKQEIENRVKAFIK